MSESITVTVSSHDLPAAELEHLLTSVGAEDGVQVETVGGDGTRGLDPGVVGHLVDLAGAVAAPFLAKLAERLFKLAPRGKVRSKAPDGSEVVVSGDDDATARASKITIILENPAPNLTITLS
ncbi:MAG TPA: hypothetical protein VG497_03975 [Kribbella sp.]|nr:hypothetical protein [Kribbella sp.]